jgi:hypothetical protein
MAKGKPDIQNFIPDNIREFAESDEPTTRTIKDNTMQTQPSKPDAPKRQTAVRLTDETMAKIRRLVGMRAMQTSRRVTTQEIMEMAIVEYVNRELGNY